jgi:hypothetical protein
MNVREVVHVTDQDVLAAKTKAHLSSNLTSMLQPPSNAYETYY